MVQKSHKCVVLALGVFLLGALPLPQGSSAATLTPDQVTLDPVWGATLALFGLLALGTTLFLLVKGIRWVVCYAHRPRPHQALLNRKQILTLWIGIGLSVGIAVFPPWVKVRIYRAGVFEETRLGSYSIWAVPTDTNCGPCAMRIDVPLLLLQWGALWLMATGLLVTWKKRALPEEPGAVQRLRQAAEQGDPNAQVRLGIMYQYGWDLPQDNSEAAQWVRRAAEQGDANAQVRLALAYSLGEGLPLDFAEAFQWYYRAANQGDIGSQYTLGLLYYAGLGVPWDVVEAYFWLYAQLPHSTPVLAS